MWEKKIFSLPISVDMNDSSLQWANSTAPQCLWPNSTRTSTCPWMALKIEFSEKLNVKLLWSTTHQNRVKIFIPSSSKLSKSTRPKTAQKSVCVVSHKLQIELWTWLGVSIQIIFQLFTLVSNLLGKTSPYDARVGVHCAVEFRK